MIAYFHSFRSTFDDLYLDGWTEYIVAEGFWPIASSCSAMRIHTPSPPGEDDQDSGEWNENVAIQPHRYILANCEENEVSHRNG